MIPKPGLEGRKRPTRKVTTADLVLGVLCIAALVAIALHRGDNPLLFVGLIALWLVVSVALIAFVAFPLSLVVGGLFSIWVRWAELVLEVTWVALRESWALLRNTISRRRELWKFL